MNSAPTRVNTGDDQRENRQRNQYLDQCERQYPPRISQALLSKIMTVNFHLPRDLVSVRFRLELLEPRLDVDRDERELRVEPTRDREMPLAPSP